LGLFDRGDFNANAQIVARIIRKSGVVDLVLQAIFDIVAIDAALFALDIDRVATPLDVLILPIRGPFLRSTSRPMAPPAMAPATVAARRPSPPPT